MTPTPWPQWPIDAVAAVLLVIGIALLALAVRRAAKRVKPHCDACRYDLTGLAIPSNTTEPPLVCPECGNRIRSWRQARRKHGVGVRLIASALVLMCAYGVWCAPAVRQRGAVALLPGAVLVALVSASPASGAGPLSELESELFYRLWRGELGWFTDSAVQLAGSSAIETRPTWPSGSAIWFRDFGRFGARGPMCEWTLVGHVVPAGPDSHTWTMRQQADCVGTRPDGEHEIPFGVHAGAAGERRFVKHISVGGAVESVIRPAPSPRANEAASAALRTGIVVVDWYKAIRVWFPGPIPSSSLHDEEGAFALGVRAQLKRNGQLLAEAPGHLALVNGVHFAVDARTEALSSAISRGDHDEISHWTITYIGDPFIALSDLPATRYWPGTLELKLSEVLK